MRMKIVWLDCYAHVVLTSPQELAKHREDCIQRDMSAFDDTREEAEHDIDWYFDENVIPVEVDLDSSPYFWVDYQACELLTSAEVQDLAMQEMPFEDWLNENYSPFRLFEEIYKYSAERIISDYQDDAEDIFTTDNCLEMIEIEG